MSNTLNQLPTLSDLAKDTYSNIRAHLEVWLLLGLLSSILWLMLIAGDLGWFSKAIALGNQEGRKAEFLALVRENAGPHLLIVLFGLLFVQAATLVLWARASFKDEELVRDGALNLIKRSMRALLVYLQMLLPMIALMVANAIVVFLLSPFGAFGQIIAGMIFLAALLTLLMVSWAAIDEVALDEPVSYFTVFRNLDWHKCINPFLLFIAIFYGFQILELFAGALIAVFFDPATFSPLMLAFVMMLFQFITMLLQMVGLVVARNLVLKSN